MPSITLIPGNKKINHLLIFKKKNLLNFMKFTDIPFHILDDIFDKGQMAILVCLMKYIVYITP